MKDYYPLLQLIKKKIYMDYWFYLEPYTFIFQTDNQAVIYNTLNSAYLICPDHPIIQSIIKEWSDGRNGYGTSLADKDLKNIIVKDFVIKIRESFSGDCVVFDKNKCKPYLFKPHLYLNTTIRVKQEKENSALGEHILQNLHEVTFYLPTSCNMQCKECKSYYKQMNHCVVCKEKILNIEDYKVLLHKIYLSGIQRVNIIGGDLLKNKFAQIFIEELPKYDFKKVFYINYKHFSTLYTNLLSIKDSEINVLIHSEDISTNLSEMMLSFSHYAIKWNFIVISAHDICKVDECNLSKEYQIKIIPYYNGHNLEFFKEYIYLDLEDIIEEPISRKTIFRHQVLNDNFFGKLFIMPSGEVFSNLNFKPIGNIKNFSLKELVYKEIIDSKAWLKVRNKETPCDMCINRDLCPPLSNYELVIGKANLCHFKP